MKIDNYIKLSDCAFYSKKRINVNELTTQNYISTDNMLPNKGGIVEAIKIPEVNTVSAYQINDILLSNIRPYFKKIWIADNYGGCSNDVLVLSVHKNFNPRFVYYALCDNNFFNYATVTSKGTKMPRGTPSAIMKYLIPKFDYNKQKVVSEILLTYDRLIENNNKRIKILEQMAEELYKEWFVKMRFPDFEKYNFKSENPKGWILGNHNEMLIPEEWKFGKVADIGLFVRGKNITKGEMIEGEIPVISAGIEPSGYHNESNVKGYSLTMSASGANAGYLNYHLNDIWAADCSYYNNDSNIWFMYNSLNFIRKAIDNLQVGSAQPHVYPKNINKLSILIPEEKYILKFNELVKPFYEEIKVLKSKNDNLAKQRDLLLPRLMSGKLEVKESE